MTPDDVTARAVEIVRDEVDDYGAVTGPRWGAPESLSSHGSDMPEQIVARLRAAGLLTSPDAITRAKAEAVANLVANIRTLHRPNPDCDHDGNPCCVDCEQIMPCLTVRLLPLTDPEESDRG